MRDHRLLVEERGLGGVGCFSVRGVLVLFQRLECFFGAPPESEGVLCFGLRLAQPVERAGLGLRAALRVEAVSRELTQRYGVGGRGSVAGNLFQPTLGGGECLLLCQTVTMGLREVALGALGLVAAQFQHVVQRETEFLSSHAGSGGVLGGWIGSAGKHASGRPNSG